MSLKNNLIKALIALFNLVQSNVIFFGIRRLLLGLAGMDIAPTATIHRKVMFYGKGRLSVGENSTINMWCLLDNRAPITIGRNVNISHNVKIYTTGHDIDDPRAVLTQAPVSIGDNAWIFPNAIIQPGVVIAEGAVVYPGTVVTKNVGAYEIWGGNPAKFIRHRNREISYKARFPVWFGI